MVDKWMMMRERGSEAAKTKVGGGGFCVRPKLSVHAININTNFKKNITNFPLNLHITLHNTLLFI